MSFRPVVRPVARAVARAVNSKTGFSPLELFASGEQGVWYDPSDLATLYQDAAGTIPVTADGDPVGRMEDKSLNGNHATQSVAASRPVYRTDGTLHWLAFDGVDDGFDIPVGLPSDSAVFWGLLRQSSARVALLSRQPNSSEFLAVADEGSPNAPAQGALGAAPEYFGNSVALAGATRGDVGGALTVGEAVVFDAQGVKPLSAWGNELSFGNYTSFLFHGDLYGLIIAGAFAEKDPTDARQYIAKKSGVVL